MTALTELCLDLESGLAELVNSQDDWRLCALLSAARQGVAGVRRRAQDEAAGEDACRVAGEALGGAPCEPGGTARPWPGAECCPACGFALNYRTTGSTGEVIDGDAIWCSRQCGITAQASVDAEMDAPEIQWDEESPAPSEPGGDCETCGGSGETPEIYGQQRSGPCPDCEGPGHIGPSSASNTPESAWIARETCPSCAYLHDEDGTLYCGVRARVLAAGEWWHAWMNTDGVLSGAPSCPGWMNKTAAPCPCGAPCPPGLAMCVECQAREGRE